MLLGMGRRRKASASETQGSELAIQTPSRPRSRRGVVGALLSLFVVIGLVTSVFAGWQWKTAVDRQARQAFDQQAGGVAGRVTKALQRATDLTATGRAVIAQDPQMTNTQLAGWFSALAGTRLADATGVAYIQSVPADQLYFFRVAMVGDIASALTAG